MREIVVDALFALLRNSLLGESLETCPRGLTTNDWEEIFLLGCRHKVSALLAEGIGRLSDSQKPDAKIVRRFNIQQDKVVRRFCQQQQSLVHLLQFFNKRGLKTMLLKGALEAAYYPISKYREYGDIDIYQFGCFAQADALISQELGIVISNDAHHHTKYVFEGTTIENHYDFVNTHTPRSNKEYEVLLKSYDDRAKEVCINGETLWLPSPTFEALFLIRHTAEHFAAGQITIRDLCDWRMFLNSQADKVEWDVVCNIYHQFNMHHFVGALQGILENWLGLESLPQLPKESDERLTSRVFNEIVVGEYQEPIYGKENISRLFWKIRRYRANKWKRRIVYSDSECQRLLDGVWSHILKPKSIIHKM